MVDAEKKRRKNFGGLLQPRFLFQRLLHVGTVVPHVVAPDALNKRRTHSRLPSSMRYQFRQLTSASCVPATA